MKTVIVFGVPDVEMKVADSLIPSFWERVYKNSVTFKDSYETSLDTINLKDFDKVVLFDCDYNNNLLPENDKVFRFGSSNFRKGWHDVDKDFLPYTNLGKLLSFLAKENLLSFTGFKFFETPHYYTSPQYFKCLTNDFGTLYDAWIIGNGFLIPQVVLCAAATNYCIPQAYLGKCNGLNRQVFLELRLKELERVTGRFPHEILSSIEAQLVILERLKVHPFHRAKFIRRNNIYREEAAYIAGIHYVYSIKYSLSFTLAGYITPQVAESWCNFMLSRNYKLSFDRWTITGSSSKKETK